MKENGTGTGPELPVDHPAGLPAASPLLQRMGAQLEERGTLSILTINVLQSSSVERITGWQAFDDIVHDVGRFLASIKTIHLRREDFVAEMMISGSAFVILLAPPRDKAAIDTRDLLRVRDRLHGKLQRFLTKRLAPDIFKRFTCFIGASQVHNDRAIRPERLIYRALDEAQADSLAEKERAAKERLRALDEVISGRLIRSVYQPILDLFGRSVIGFEALSRPAGGPFDDIQQVYKAAYDSKSIWHLERLCRERAMEGLPSFHRGEMLFLNVEPDSVHDPHFRSERTLKLLSQAALSPEQVVLEMTEHSAVKDFTAFRQTLTYFRTLGFRLAIDDMGSGYSSLSSLAEIRPDFVKLDMSLVRDVHKNLLKRELVATITRFARRVGIHVVAEGIETEDELSVLMETGVLLGQGYLFARPAFPPAAPDMSMLERRAAAR